jgi:hypothetical protein
MDYECVSCQENITSDENKSKSIYLLPCLHQMCSDCLNDIKSNNLKHNCVSCYEQFDLEIVKKIIQMIDINVNTNDEQISKNKNTIHVLDLSIVKSIDQIISVIKYLTEYKNEIIEMYNQIYDKIVNISPYYDDIKDNILNQHKILQKTDLKIIDSEIESYDVLLNRYNKFSLMIKSISLNHHEFDKIISYIKQTFTFSDTLNKTSLVKRKEFDSSLNEIVCEPIEYSIDNNLQFMKIPSNVTHLTINNNVDRNFGDFIPSTVTHLNLTGFFNQNIKGCIPNTVTHLYIGYYFAHEIKDIPESVTHLTIGCNQNIKGCIPSSVTHLTFDQYFNMDVKDCIPNSVTHLIFGDSFKQNIKDCIPNSVTHLTLGKYFDQDIKDSIPSSVTNLTIVNLKNKDIVPKSVTHLTINAQYSGICYLKGCIPDSVTHLTFGSSFDENIKDCLPNSITHLIFGYKFNQNIKGCIPNSVVYLEFSDYYNQDITDCIPESVTHLTIGDVRCKILNCSPDLVIIEDHLNL